MTKPTSSALRLLLVSKHRVNSQTLGSVCVAMNASTDVLATIGWHVQMVKPVEVMLSANRMFCLLLMMTTGCIGTTDPSGARYLNSAPKRTDATGVGAFTLPAPAVMRNRMALSVFGFAYAPATLRLFSGTTL